MFLPDINTSDKSNNKYDISVAIAAPKAPNLGIRIIFIITFESALKEVSIANNLSIPCGKKYCVLKVVDHAIKSNETESIISKLPVSSNSLPKYNTEKSFPNVINPNTNNDAKAETYLNVIAKTLVFLFF